MKGLVVVLILFFSACKTFQYEEAIFGFNQNSPAISPNGDGKDEQGNIAADDTYRLVLSATDAAGNTAEQTIDDIVVDTKTPAVNLTASETVFSPDGDGINDTLIFSFTRAEDYTAIISWKLIIGNLVGEGEFFLSACRANPPGSLNGTGGAGRAGLWRAFPNIR